MIALPLLFLAGALPPRALQAPPGPKAAIAGFAGFHSRSRLSPAKEGEEERVLEVYYVFPERARWQLLRSGAPASERLLYFRFGDAYWVQRPEVARSDPLEGDELDATAALIELRRALMLWPDGIPWGGEGSIRNAESAVAMRAPAGQPRQVLLLRARLDEQGRPRELEGRWQDPSGNEAQLAIRFREVTWREHGGRWWPHTLILEGSGVEGWRETIESVDPRLDSLDHFFLPADRKPASVPPGIESPLSLVLPPALERRVPLSERSTWEEVVQEARKLRDEHTARAAELGLELERAFAIELDDGARPLACLLRLKSDGGKLPEGWSRIAGREGLALRRTARDPVNVLDLERLRALVPKGSRAGAAYLRFPETPGAADSAQLLQPFERPR